MADPLLGERRGSRRIGCVSLIVVAVLLLLCSRFFANLLIEYEWWKGLGQEDTWFNLWLYSTIPVLVVIALLFAVFWTAYRAGIRRPSETPMFGFLHRRTVSWVVAAGLALLAIAAGNATVNNWTVVRYLGGLRLPQRAEYADPIFGKRLHFFFFGLPFYETALRVVLTCVVLALIIYWLAAHAEKLSRQLPNFGRQGAQFDFEPISLRDAFDSHFVRVMLAILLLGVAAKVYLNRFDLLFQDHGQYLVGVDWVADHIVLPLQWCEIIAAVVGTLLVLTRKGRWALILLLVMAVRMVLPGIIASLYVRPNELALEKPYIQHHIDATRSAYGLNQRVKESALDAELEIPIDYTKHQALLDNVRLWDWRAFHDTISQIQPLRPYVYTDTDVDRYVIDGRLRQVLLSPRELEIRQLGEAQNRWINTHLIYTHGYGLVMAEANRITADGLPLLFVKDAPPVVTTKSLQLTQPELYFSEQAHEPVYVGTSQQEFNYPSGSESVYTTYKGPGGISIGSELMRLAAAVNYGDLNVLLTSYLTSQSRMMIHRPTLERLSTLAPFLTWDPDPYIVLTDAGKLVWIADGYMSSNAHPYSRELELGGNAPVNYIRNSVKATVDAYTGEVSFYIFDPNDVLIEAYSRLFPNLFKPESAMPADLRRHVRYPETLFNAQAEIYRTFHMRDPEAFYNRADLWDLSKTAGTEGTTPVSPTYVVAALPGQNTAEFMLLTTFTPANKNNLIGVMYARCDGEHLGELVFEELSKQNIIYGPIQIDARINQDQNISKDLSLWNQQGSQVLRGQTLVLPIDKSFLYVEPIYIQASQASMPQLKKVALAMGNTLVYKDTYEQALAELIQESGGGAPAELQNTQVPQQGAQAPAQAAANQAPQPSGANAAVPSPQQTQAVQTLQKIRDHLQRYRELSAQGKWAEAGKELDTIQQLLQK
ncbi:MAG: UPF0182 family protein [Acidobacteriaceae bacterium]|nr:UPF0182 family protein [Acidobacteriaceae bacterium]